MSTKPEPQDFGIAPKDYDLYQKGPQSDHESSTLGGLFTLVALLLTVFTVGILFGSEAAISTFFGGIFLGFFVWIWLSNAILSFRRDWLLRGSVASQIKLYEEALIKYNLAEEEAEIQQYIAEAPGASEMADEDWASARPANQEMKKPELEDFGITLKDYNLYQGKYDWGTTKFWFLWHLVIFLVPFFTELFISQDWEAALTVGFLYYVVAVIPAYFVTLLFEPIFVRFKRDRQLKSSIAPQIKLYEEALKAYNLAKEEAERQQREAKEAEQEAERQRRVVERRRREAHRQQQRIREQFWESMDGVEFERELGGLFQAMGYGVQMTPRSGDQGVDLVLRKDRVTTVVQCKAQKARASSPIARELLGSMVAFGARKAILACTGGFTRGVRDFVEGKPISLLDSSDIARMAERVGGVVGVVDKLPKATRRGRADQEREPSCPKCRRRMVLRDGSRGEFWGCPAYPNCTGTRDISG